MSTQNSREEAYREQIKEYNQKTKFAIENTIKDRYYNRRQTATLANCHPHTLDDRYRSGTFKENEVKVIHRRRMFKGSGILRVFYGIED